MAGFIDINGKIHAEDKAFISAFDRGFLLGDGCFEVLRVKKGKFLFLEDHLDRLFWGLDSLCLKLNLTRSELKKRMLYLVSFSNISSAYFRVTVTRGSGMGFVDLHDQFDSNCYLYVKEICENKTHKSQGSSQLTLVAQNYTDRTPRIKTNAYQKTLGSLHKASLEGFNDILWFNSCGEITEASTSNVFFVEFKKSHYKVVTPCVSSGLLAGVTRKNFIECMREHAIPLEERKILKEDLTNYTECFLSSSIKHLVPVSRVDDLSYNTLSSKSFFRKASILFEAYGEKEV